MCSLRFCYLFVHLLVIIMVAASGASLPNIELPHCLDELVIEAVYQCHSINSMPSSSRYAQYCVNIVLLTLSGGCTWPLCNCEPTKIAISAILLSPGNQKLSHCQSINKHH